MRFCTSGARAKLSNSNPTSSIWQLGVLSACNSTGRVNSTFTYHFVTTNIFAFRLGSGQDANRSEQRSGSPNCAWRLECLEQSMWESDKSRKRTRWHESSDAQWISRGCWGGGQLGALSPEQQQTYSKSVLIINSVSSLCFGEPRLQPLYKRLLKLKQTRALCTSVLCSGKNVLPGLKNRKREEEKENIKSLRKPQLQINKTAFEHQDGTSNMCYPLERRMRKQYS